LVIVNSLLELGFCFFLSVFLPFFSSVLITLLVFVTKINFKNTVSLSTELDELVSFS